MNSSNVEQPRTADSSHSPSRKWLGIASAGFHRPIVSLMPDSNHPAIAGLPAQPVAVLLGMIPSLRFVTPAGLHGLADLTHRRQVEIGDVVVSQNEHSDDVFFIVTGMFEVMIRHFGQTADFIRMLRPGDSFGELGVLYDVPRTATVRCTAAGEILCIPGAAFLDALDDVR